jgi:heme/copper-type cytochrome/quinol oxidase subunit 2
LTRRGADLRAHADRVHQYQGYDQLMEWTPVLFIAIKITVFVLCMFFAIRWHYDQDTKENEMPVGAVIFAGVKVAAVFVLSVLVLGLLTFVICWKLGLDLTLP